MRRNGHFSGAMEGREWKELVVYLMGIIGTLYKSVHGERNLEQRDISTVVRIMSTTYLLEPTKGATYLHCTHHRISVPVSKQRRC